MGAKLSICLKLCMTGLLLHIYVHFMNLFLLVG